VLEQPKSLMTPRRRITAIRIGNAVAPLWRLDSNMRMPMVSMFLLVAQEDGLRQGIRSQREAYAVLGFSLGCRFECLAD
jgi:hypothetical protein